MRPRKSLDNMPDRLTGKSISIRQFPERPFSRGIKLPYIDDLLFGQFRAQVPLSPSGLASSFGFSIPIIVQPSSKKQVGRPKAWWVVALVKYAQSFWNSANRENVCDTMDSIYFSCGGLSNRTIATFVVTLATRPLDAGIVLRNALEHLFQELNIANLVSHLRALHGSWCQALAALQRRGAFLILAQGIV